MREPRLDERALLRIGHVLLERPVELLTRDRRFVLLADPAPHANHVGERPVRHSLAVGETTATVPVRRLSDPVEVLVELPREPRLADSRDPGHRHEMRLPALGALVEEVLRPSQIAVSTDERCLEPCRLELAAGTRDDPKCPPQHRRLVLALERMRAGVLVDDGLLGCAMCRVADQHRSRLGSCLDPRGGVDEIPRHHALALGTDRHRCLTGEDTGPGTQLRRADFVAERRHRRHEVERGAHRALAVVLGRSGRAPHRHDCVADELLDSAAVQPDQPAARVEVARKELAHLLRVAPLRQRREADQIGEQHRDEAPLGDRSRLGGQRRSSRAACRTRCRTGHPRRMRGRSSGTRARAGYRTAGRTSRRPRCRARSSCRSPPAEPTALASIVEDRFDIVAARVEDERAVVARVVLRPLAGRAVVGVTGLDRAHVERRDRVGARHAEGEVDMLGRRRPRRT